MAGTLLMNIVPIENIVKKEERREVKAGVEMIIPLWETINRDMMKEIIAIKSNSEDQCLHNIAGAVVEACNEIMKKEMELTTIGEIALKYLYLLRIKIEALQFKIGIATRVILQINIITAIINSTTKTDLIIWILLRTIKNTIKKETMIHLIITLMVIIEMEVRVNLIFNLKVT